MTSELHADFISLFEGNSRAVGAEDGACIRVPDVNAWCQHLARHLDKGGKFAVGVYPLMPRYAYGDPNGTYDWQVHWGCVDFDGHRDGECYEHAVNVASVLRMFGVTAWIERTRSGAGYHVWVFERRNQFAPSRIVRDGLLAACQIVDAPTKEINPKSYGFPDPDILGNYVRLPYPGWMNTIINDADVRRRCMVRGLDGTGFYALGEFVTMAHEFAGLDGLAGLAERYVPPAPKAELALRDEVHVSTALTDRMAPLTWHVFASPPTVGTPRHAHLMRLAYLLKRGGCFTPDEAFAILKDWDARFGKFHGRPDCDRRILDTLEKAWAE